MIMLSGFKDVETIQRTGNTQRMPTMYMTSVPKTLPVDIFRLTADIPYSSLLPITRHWTMVSTNMMKNRTYAIAEA